MRLGLAMAVAAFLPGVVAAEDWSGLYAVLGQPQVSGDLVEYFNGSPSSATASLDGEFTSIVIGHNWQKQNLVYGVELGYSTGKVSLPPFPSSIYLEDALDLRGRIGLATGRVLIFATLGYARSTHEVPEGPGGPADGMSYGFGVDFMATDHFFFGVEVLRRNLEVDQGVSSDVPLFSYDEDMQTVGLRLGLKF